MAKEEIKKKLLLKVLIHGLVIFTIGAFLSTCVAGLLSPEPLHGIGNPPRCFTTEDSGNVVYSSHDAQASTNEWVELRNTALSLNDEYTLTVSGAVQFCAQAKDIILKPTKHWGDSNNNGTMESNEWNRCAPQSPTGSGGKLTFSCDQDWNARNGCWYKIPVKPGQKLEITVTGQYSDRCSANNPSEPYYIYNKGKGMQMKLPDGSLLMYPGEATGGKHTLVAPANMPPDNRYLRLRHFDGCQNITRGLDRNDPNSPFCDHYKDNRGGYTVSIKGSTCSFLNGEHLYYTISPTKPTYGVTSSNAISLKGGVKNAVSNKIGKIWLRIHDKDNVYTKVVNGSPSGGNFGHYPVSATITKKGGIFTDFSSILIKPVMDMLNTVTVGIYKNIVKDSMFLKFVRSLLILYVTVVAAMFVMGMVELTQKELVIRIIKVGVILTLISPTSFEVFNTYFFSLFTNGVTQLMSIFAGAEFDVAPRPYDPSTLGTKLWDRGATPNFSFLDNTVSKLFSSAIWLKIISLLVLGPAGLFFSLVIIVSIFFFVAATARAIIIYLLSMLGISLMLIVAPIFISFILFDKTKSLFDAWVKQIVGFALQPILILAALPMFNYLMQAAIVNVFGFSSCWRCLWTLPLNWLTLGGLTDICWVYAYQPWGFENGLDASTTDFGGFTLPISLGILLLFAVIAQAAYKFTDFAIDIAANVSSVSSGAGLGGAASAGVKAAAQPMKAAFGIDKGSKEEREQKEQGKKPKKTSRKTGGGTTASKASSESSGDSGGLGGDS